MKKKVLSILLSMLLLSSGVLTGCSSQSDSDETVEATADVEESSRVSMTLSLWLPTSENTTDEAIELVEEALNAVTRAKFDTAIELHAIAEDEYQKAIDARLEEVARLTLEAEEAEELLEDAKDAKEEADAESESEVETYKNELGVSLIKYPEVEKTQLDIFLVQGYDNYLRYVDSEYLQSLDGELTSTSKILKTYIYPTLLNLAKSSTYGTYAIPNNRPLGEYKYLLINKDFADNYDYNVDKLTTLAECETFIRDIGSKNIDGMIPLLDSYDLNNMEYWSIDGEWSLLASQIPEGSDYNTKVAPRNILAMPSYTNNLILMKSLDELGYIGDGTLEEGEQFGVAIMDGYPGIFEDYEEDYYIKVCSTPVADSEDIFGNMFAVSAYTKNLTRSMEIITLLNTNPEFRTILQYGVEGVHWAVDNDNADVIKILSDDYQMDIYATGNTYMTYPGEGAPMTDWDYYKEQNLVSAVSPYLFFEGYVTDKNKSMMNDLAELSKTFKTRLDKMTAAELEAALNDLKTEVNTNAVMTKILDKEEGAVGPVAVYETYYSDNY